jgi:hypothetical protein
MKTKIVFGLLASWLAYESQTEGLPVNYNEMELAKPWPVQHLLEELFQEQPSAADTAPLSGVLSPMAAAESAACHNESLESRVFAILGEQPKATQSTRYTSASSLSASKAETQSDLTS